MRLLFAPAVTKKDKERERLAKEAAARPKTPEEEIMDSQEAYNDAKRADDLGPLTPKPLSPCTLYRVRGVRVAERKWYLSPSEPSKQMPKCWCIHIIC